MVIREIVNINGKDFQKHCSDKNVYIKKVGTDEEYGEAIDLIEKNYQYEETDKKLEELKDEFRHN